MNGEEHDTSQSSVVEVIAPSVMMEMEKFVVRQDSRRLESGGNSRINLGSCDCSLVCLYEFRKHFQDKIYYYEHTNVSENKNKRLINVYFQDGKTNPPERI